MQVLLFISTFLFLLLGSFVFFHQLLSLIVPIISFHIIFFRLFSSIKKQEIMDQPSIQQFTLRSQTKKLLTPSRNICVCTFQVQKYTLIPTRQSVTISIIHSSHDPRFISKMDAYNMTGEPLGQTYIIPFDKIYFVADIS